MNIITYIGKEGVQSIPLDEYSRPLPGDPVCWKNGTGYPFNDGTIGRLEDFGGFEKDKWHLCCSLGSVFWSSFDRVSISGGPFACIEEKKLVWTGKFKTVSFWNWGDNSPGANQGVHYYVDRPLWEYIK